MLQMVLRIFRSACVIAVIGLTGNYLALGSKLGTKQTKYVCEGDRIHLKCMDGEVIHIIRANYGRYSNNRCNDRGEDWPNTQCRYLGSIRVMRERCDGRSDCIVKADDETFKDRCPDTYKYLEASFSCVLPEPPLTPTEASKAEKLETSEAETDASTNEPITRVSNRVTPSTTRTTTSRVSRYMNTPSALPNLATEKKTYCQPTLVRQIEWPLTQAGYQTEAPCPNTDIDQGSAMWLCSDNGIWSNNGPNLANCVSPDMRKLAKSASETNSPIRIKDLARQLRDETRYKPLYGGDTMTASDVLETLVESSSHELQSLPVLDQKQFSRDLSETVVETCSNLLNEHQDPGWRDLNIDQRHESGGSLIDSIEQAGLIVAKTMTINSETFTKKSSNVFLEVSVVPVQSHNQFPSRSIYQPQLDSIQLPAEALLTTEESRLTGVSKVVFATYDSKMGNILTPKPRVEAVDGKQVTVDRFVASKIISTTVNNGDGVGSLAEPAYITLAIERRENATRPQCVYWSYSATSSGEWSSDGCKLVRDNESHAVCACNHLTHFAVLMDAYGLELSIGHELALIMLTYAGCTISIVCLFCAMLVFHCCARQSERLTIHKNLCFCLLVAESIFIAGIAQTQHRILCGFVAGLLQYFFLAAFVWMLLEGFQLYALLIEVFEPDNDRTKYFYALGYGMPLIIVAIAAGVDYNSYGTDRHCWLNTDNYFVFSFIGPVAVILLVNIIFLLMAMCIMARHKSVSFGYQHYQEKSSLENIGAWLKGAFVLVFLLGLTWGFGLVYLNQDTVVMAYVFTVLNSLQGLFIFLFHIIFNTRMQKELSDWVRRNDWLPDCIRKSVGIGYTPASPGFHNSTLTGSSQNETKESFPSPIGKLFPAREFSKRTSAQLLLTRSSLSCYNCTYAKHGDPWQTESNNYPKTHHCMCAISHPSSYTSDDSGNGSLGYSTTAPIPPQFAAPEPPSFPGVVHTCCCNSFHEHMPPVTTSDSLSSEITSYIDRIMSPSQMRSHHHNFPSFGVQGAECCSDPLVNSKNCEGAKEIHYAVSNVFPGTTFITTAPLVPDIYLQASTPEANDVPQISSEGGKPSYAPLPVSRGLQPSSDRHQLSPLPAQMSLSPSDSVLPAIATGSSFNGSSDCMCYNKSMPHLRATGKRSVREVSPNVYRSPNHYQDPIQLQQQISLPELSPRKELPVNRSLKCGEISEPSRTLYSSEDSVAVGQWQGDHYCVHLHSRTLHPRTTNIGQQSKRLLSNASIPS